MRARAAVTHYPSNPSTTTSAPQASLTARALELLALPNDGAPKLLLDVGCGSGLSGEALSEAGHAWVGCDISEAMLDVAVEREVGGGVVFQYMCVCVCVPVGGEGLLAGVAWQQLSARGTWRQRRGSAHNSSASHVPLNACHPLVIPTPQVEGDVLLSDMGQGVPLRRGVFDGAISISAVQWLCNADRSSHDPRKRLKRFFETLYGCLARGARAVLQVRPRSGAAWRGRASLLVRRSMAALRRWGLCSTRLEYPRQSGVRVAGQAVHASLQLALYPQHPSHPCHAHPLPLAPDLP